MQLIRRPLKKLCWQRSQMKEQNMKQTFWRKAPVGAEMRTVTG
jgi:hypothetical protein